MSILTYFFKKSTVCRLRVAKLWANNHNSYGFTFDGFVSMETALTFDPKGFLKITVFLTSSTVSYIYYVSFFFIKPMVEYHNSML